MKSYYEVDIYRRFHINAAQTLIFKRLDYNHELSKKLDSPGAFFVDFKYKFDVRASFDNINEHVFC